MKVVNAGVLLLLCAVAPAAMAADGDAGGCLVALDSRAPADHFPEGLRAVAPTSSEQRSSVLFVCRAGRVSGVNIRLLPGQAAEVRLVHAGAPEYLATLTEEDGLPSDWVRLDSSRLDSRTVLLTLTIAAPESAMTGRVFSDHLRLAPARAGLDVPVTLEIIDNEPLFRDEFDDVDPVMGQFSMSQGARQSLFTSPLASSD